MKLNDFLRIVDTVRDMSEAETRLVRTLLTKGAKAIERAPTGELERVGDVVLAVHAFGYAVNEDRGEFADLTFEQLVAVDDELTRRGSPNNPRRPTEGPPPYDAAQAERLMMESIARREGSVVDAADVRWSAPSFQNLADADGNPVEWTEGAAHGVTEPEGVEGKRTGLDDGPLLPRRK